jgi:hypothetical protein
VAGPRSFSLIFSLHEIAILECGILLTCPVADDVFVAFMLVIAVAPLEVLSLVFGKHIS